MMYQAKFICILGIFASALVVHAKPATPQVLMSLAVEPKTSAWIDFPVTIQLKSLPNGQTVTTDDIDFFLLGEDGNEVAMGVLYPIETPQSTVSKNGQASLPLKLRWDPYISGHVPVGKRYQLICTCKTLYGAVAGSAWFKLMPQNEP